jgi:hypothetical protein
VAVVPTLPKLRGLLPRREARCRAPSSARSGRKGVKRL